MFPFVHTKSIGLSFASNLNSKITREFHSSQITALPFVGLTKGSKRLNNLLYHYYKPPSNSPDAKLAPVKPGWKGAFLKRAEDEQATNRAMQKNYPLKNCIDEIGDKNRIRFGTLWKRYPYWLNTKSTNGLSNPAKREERILEKKEAKKLKRIGSRKRWLRRKPVFPSAKRVKLSEEVLEGDASPLKALESIRVTQSPEDGHK